MLFFLAVLFSFSHKAQAADAPPFAYLNQRYNYEYVNDSSFKLNNSLQVFDSLAILETDTYIQISMKDTAQFITKYTVLEVLDKDNTLIESQPTELINNEFNQVLNISPKKISSVCLVTTNEFTTKKLCKKFASIDESVDPPDNGKLTFSANGIQLDSIGKIILNDKTQNVIFRAENSRYFLELITGYKKIILSRASKIEKSNSIQADFFELKQPNKYNFRSKIKLSDTSFKIAIDDLITVYQDIYFLDEELFEKAVDYEFTDWKVRKYKKLGVEPIILYSQLRVDSAVLIAKIVSDLSKGVKIYYTNYPSNVLEYYFSGKIILLQLINDVNTNAINNKSLSVLTLDGGLRYYRSPDFHFDLNFAMQEFVYAEYQPTRNSVDMSKGLSPTLTLSANKILTEFEKWRLQGWAGFGVIGPTKIPSGETKLAPSLIFGSQLSYKLRGGRIYYGFDFTSYKTSNSAYNYNRQALEHKVGFYYLY
ncbi:MAG: hypothetical protein AABY53_06370 [Bdellovibrionota bacterium]